MFERIKRALAVALATMGLAAVAAVHAEAATDSGRTAKVVTNERGGTLRVEVTARGGIALWVTAVDCDGSGPAIWVHRGTQHQKLVYRLPDEDCKTLTKARAMRGRVRIRVT